MPEILRGNRPSIAEAERERRAYLRQFGPIKDIVDKHGEEPQEFWPEVAEELAPMLGSSDVEQRQEGIKLLGFAMEHRMRTRIDRIPPSLSDLVMR